MKTLQLLGLFLLLSSFFTALAIISSSAGVVLPKSLFVYWLFWLITTVSGTLLLFSATSWKQQLLPLRLWGALNLLISSVATLFIIGDLLGFYTAQHYMTLWFFFLIPGIAGGLYTYFAHELLNTTPENSKE